MTAPTKKAKLDPIATAAANFYNSTGSVLPSINLPLDISYLTTTHPSNTIVVGDVPVDCSEIELLGLFARYGSATRCQKICNGRAALIEFSEISSPTRLVHMAKINPFFVGPNRVMLEFSKQSVTMGVSLKHNSTEALNKSGKHSKDPTKILHFHITKVDYPITVDVLKAICEPHGRLIRIFIGKRNDNKALNAYIEYSKIEEAVKAKDQLDNADIYSGCCSLNIHFTNLDNVHVEKNGEDQWDFTNSNGTSKSLLDPSNIEITEQPVGPTSVQFSSAPVTYPPGYTPPAQQIVYQVTQAPSYSSSMPYPPAPHSYVMLPTPPPIHHVTPEGIGIGHATANLGADNCQRHEDMSIFRVEQGCVILVSNLSLSMNCDHLFNIMCVYGNITKIKFLKTRPGSAMVQFGSKDSAELAYKFYNRMDLSGYPMYIYFTSYAELLEREDLGILQDGSPVMKNYMMDPNNRFRNPLVASKSRILEPTRTLHFFNAPLQFTPPDMMHIFAEAGCRPPPRVIVFTPKAGQKTALGLVEWDTTTEAVAALCLCNHRPLHLSGYTHPFHLKLAFSPKPLGDDRAGMTLVQYPAPRVTSPIRYKPRPEDELDVDEVEREEERYLQHMPPGGYPEDAPNGIPVDRKPISTAEYEKIKEEEFNSKEQEDNRETSKSSPEQQSKKEDTLPPKRNGDGSSQHSSSVPANGEKSD